jgi:hypothetical protein
MLAAAPASAAEPITLGLGGFYANSIGMNFAEDDGPGESGDGRNDFDIHQNIEVFFTGETTLDNGITVGAQMQLEGDDDAERWDEAWAYFQGGFGEIRAGSEDEAALLTCVGDPSAVTRNFGNFSPNEAYNNAGVNGLAGVNSFGNCYGVGGDGLKLLYFTPQFGPFNFVVSYAPEANADDKGPTAGTSLEADADDQEDAFSVGGNFNHEGNGWSLLASLGGSWVTDDVGDSDETEFYQAGFQIGFGAFTVGAGGEIINNYNDAFGVTSTGGGDLVADDSDLWTTMVGASYAFDAWTVGLGWTHGQMEISSGGDEDTIDYISLNGAYALGPGIALEGNVGYVNYADDDTDGADADYDAFEVGLGTSIDF